MLSSRGYQCMDGPLAGEVLMITGPLEVGTSWNVLAEDGSTLVYEFRGDHFAYASLSPAVDEPSQEVWPGRPSQGR